MFPSEVSKVLEFSSTLVGGELTKPFLIIGLYFDSLVLILLMLFI